MSIRGFGRAAACVLALLLAGCQYEQGSQAPAGGTSGRSGVGAESLSRPGISSVAVPIFHTRDYHRDAEFMLTRAVVQNIGFRTPYKVLPAEQADTLLEGEILAIRDTRLSDDRFSAVPQEQLVVVVVNFTWKDLRTGKILVDRRNFEQASTYYPTLGENRFTGVIQACESMAGSIVQEMQGDW